MQISTRIARQKSSRRATASVEFAVTSLAFFLIVMGIIELGRGLMVNYLLTNAARCACRAGIVPGATTEQITQIAQDRLVGNVKGVTVKVLVNDTPGDASTAVSGDRITITITVPVSKVTYLPTSRFLKGNLSGTYTLKRE